MPATDASPFRADLDLIREAAAEAGRIALKYFRNEPEVWMKEGRSPVSAADYAVDYFLREHLRAARPDYGWLSEETIDAPARLAAARTFVVDPIDGTRGFLEGRSTWCVSIAVVEAGLTLAGVLDCPAKKTVFSALAGGGTLRNGAPIRVREPGDRPAVGGPKPMIDALPAALRDRIERTAYVPSLAYRIAMIAEGSLDASFVKPRSHDWDLAAADLILREAGGRILDEAGRQPTFAGAEVVHGALVAGSGPLLDVLARSITGSAAG